MICLALGSNLGNRLQNISRAQSQIHEIATVLQCGPVYETSAAEVVDQPNFYNTAITIETNLEPLALLCAIKSIEKQIEDKVDRKHNQPRHIDIDIIMFHDYIISLPSLVIPHPKAHQRDFVLFPLAHIAKDLFHPQRMKTIHQLRNEIEKTTIIRTVTE